MASPAQAPRFNNPNYASSSPWARGASHDVYHYPSTGQPMPPVQPQYNVSPQPPAYANNYQPVAYGPTSDQQQNFNNAPVASENKRRKQLLIGAGVLTAATATIATAGALVFGGVKGESKEGPQSNASTSEGYIPTQEQPSLSIDALDVRTEDYGRQLDAVIPFLEENREESMQAIIDDLPDPDQFTGDRKWAQQVMNNFSADLRTASTQENTILGRNLLAGIYAPSAASRTSVGEQIGNGQGAISSRKLVDAVSEKYASGFIEVGTDKIDINGSETVLINVIDQNDIKTWNVYVSTRKSQNGQYEIPVIVAEVEYGHQDFVSDIANWQPEES